MGLIRNRDNSPTKAEQLRKAITMLMTAKDKDHKYYKQQQKNFEKAMEESEKDILELTNIIKEKDKEIKL
jgi:hypothetical protein